MRIVYVLEHYHPYIGGAEKLFKQLAENMATRGHGVTVVTTRFDTALPREESLNGVRVLRLDCGNRFLFTFCALPRLLKETRHADLIHSTTYTAALPAWLAAAYWRKPSVLTFHEYWNKLWFTLPFLTWWQRRAYFLFEWLVFRLPYGKIVAVSDFTRQALIQGGKPPERVHHIYNGLEAGRYPKREQAPEGFICTYFGRLGVSKGLELLIPAMARHLRDYPDTEFRLVLPKTPRKMHQNITKLLDKEGIATKIKQYHDLPERALWETIRTSSCVVIPSHSEGFCFAAAEAVAQGVPVISSGKGALREVVSGAYLEMRGMDIDSLCSALEKARRGDWQYKEERHFPLSEAVRGYLELYGIK